MSPHSRALGGSASAPNRGAANHPWGETSAVAAEAALLLFGGFPTQRAKPRVDHRGLVEIAVAGLRGELELVDRRAEVALPRVVLALMAVRHHLLVHRGVGARGREV